MPDPTGVSPIMSGQLFGLWGYQPNAQGSNDQLVASIKALNSNAVQPGYINSVLNSASLTSDQKNVFLQNLLNLAQGGSPPTATDSMGNTSVLRQPGSTYQDTSHRLMVVGPDGKPYVITDPTNTAPESSYAQKQSWWSSLPASFTQSWNAPGQYQGQQRYTPGVNQGAIPGMAHPEGSKFAIPGDTTPPPNPKLGGGTPIGVGFRGTSGTDTSSATPAGTTPPNAAGTAFPGASAVPGATAAQQRPSALPASNPFLPSGFSQTAPTQEFSSFSSLVNDILGQGGGFGGSGGGGFYT